MDRGQGSKIYTKKEVLNFLKTSLVIRLGLEPRTPTLKVLCSTS